MWNLTLGDLTIFDPWDESHGGFSIANMARDLPSLKLPVTLKRSQRVEAPENGWLEYDPLPFGAKGLFAGAFAVSFREGNSSHLPGDLLPQKEAHLNQPECFICELFISGREVFRNFPRSRNVSPGVNGGRKPTSWRSQLVSMTWNILEMAGDPYEFR